LLPAKECPRPVVIPHGISSHRVGTAKGRAKGSFSVGTFGFLMPHKNSELLIDAVERMRPYLPGIRLKLLNCCLPNRDSRLVRARIETMIEILGLDEVVTARFDFMEEEDIVQSLADCDLLVFPYAPSDEAATGAARLALTADRPLLCSTSGTLVGLHSVAHVIHRLDSQALAEVMLALYADPVVRQLHDAERREFAAIYDKVALALRYCAHIDAALEHGHG
jgi:glycosyltransferase involved in cell wall biosynthesis